MTFKIRKFLLYALCSMLFAGFTGCGWFKKITKKKEKPALPKMLVLTIQCEDLEVSEKITKGLIENIEKKIEVVGEKDFAMTLGTRPIAMEDYFPSGSFPLFQKLSRDLFRKQEVRTKFYFEAGVDFLAKGEAKEKKWGELETGFVKTAETAELKFLDLKTGTVLLEERFEQGLFEIVAPERIGTKFAGKINKRLNQLRKQQKKEQKERRKRLRIY